MGRLNGKIAIITGAASGMGLEHAKLFVKEGAKVVITDVNETDGKALETELGSDNALFLTHDVSKLAEWEQVVIETEKKFGPVNILVNNAGIGQMVSIEDLTEENYRKVISINQDGVVFGMHSVVNSMKKGTSGSIINISSTAGLAGIKACVAYCASKFAVRGMTKAAALDLAPYNIRVNSVHPGLIDTPILSTATDEVREHMRATIPLNRIGEASEVSKLVLFLATDEASFSTGAEFVADGGVSNEL